VKQPKGWVAVGRNLVESEIYKDSRKLHIWMHLLLNANHKKGQAVIGHQVIDLEPGQQVTGQKSIAYATGVNRNFVQRVLVLFENLGYIEQQITNKYRVISITNWERYQNPEQQASNKRAADEQQMSTNNNDNNVNNKDNNKKRFKPPALHEVVEYVNEKQLTTVDPAYFISFYESKNWMVGKNKMSNWKSAVSGWHNRNLKKQGKNQHGQRPQNQSKADRHYQAICDLPDD